MYFFFSIKKKPHAGLILVPNGVYIGEAFGEDYSDVQRSVASTDTENAAISSYWSRAGMNAFSDSQGKDAAHMLAANTNDEEYSNFSNENISESVTTEDTTMEETAETVR